MAQETSFDVSWALFFVPFASSYPVVLFCRCSIPGHCRPRRLFALSRGFELHLFPPHKQLLTAVVRVLVAVLVSIVVLRQRCH